MGFRGMGSPPSLQEWSDLYRVAMEFKGVGCWNWMADSDVFGIQNPEDGEIGYCCVMGMLGEHFALAVYLGTGGLDGYLKIRSGEFSSYPHDLLMFQKCLMASFEDRESLRKRDLQIIKGLGLKFRGRNSWPLFRSYRPGYYPWFLRDREARFLALALQQAIEVSLRFKEDPDLLTPPKKNYYLVRLPEKGVGGLEWRDEWLKPAPIKRGEVKVEPVDEARLRRIEEEASRGQGVWETDFLLSPMSVLEKREERPYYPFLFLWVDHHSGLILNIHLTEQPGDLSEFSSQLLDVIENIKTLPDWILVRKEDAFRLLKPVASKLKINLKLVERLECLEEAMINMLHLLDARSR
jgi:hypothetical protein